MTARPVPAPCKAERRTLADHDETTDDLGTLLGVWAHPDDEAYLCGGLMAAARDAGHRVVSVTATLGERGTDDPDRWPPERLAPVRAAELAAALDVLGVDEHRVLGYRGRRLRGRARRAPRSSQLVEIIREVRPDTILTFGPDGITGHPDHRAVGRLGPRGLARGRHRRPAASGP